MIWGWNALHLATPFPRYRFALSLPVEAGNSMI